MAPVTSSKATVAGGQQLTQPVREVRDAFVDVEVGGAVQVIVVQPELVARVGRERGEQVGKVVVDQHDGHWTLDVAAPRVAQRPVGPGGVGHVAVVEQDQGVDTLVGHERSQPGPAIAAHPRQVGHRRQVQTRRGQGELGAHQRSRPRNVMTFVLTILRASSGPTAATMLASDCSE